MDIPSLLEKLKGGNCFGEPVTLVAATKTRTPAEIQAAIGQGITDIGENRVQEFCAKFGAVHGAAFHFIGRLQTNKVKYLVGRTRLIHSVDSDALAAEIARRARSCGTVQDILVEINIGGEASKGGFAPEEGYEAFRRYARTEGLSVRGFMTVLPPAEEDILRPLAKQMRALFERAREEDPAVTWLSMGMSGDWELCLSEGSNMIRLGTAIFGPRQQT